MVSALTALYLFEIYITFNQIKSKDQRIKKQINIKQKKFMEKTGDKFDIRSRYEIYSDLKREDSDIQVTFHSSDIMTEKNNIFSFAGISKSKTINCNEMDIIQSTKVTDMALIIQIKSGIKKKLSSS